MIHADPTENIYASFNISKMMKQENSSLELYVNDKKIENWTCQIATKGNEEVSFFYDNAKKISPLDWNMIDSFQVWNGLLIIKNIKVDGFDLEPFSFQLFSDYSLAYRNKMNTFATISPPQIMENGANIQIDYEIKIGTIGNLKILDSEGIELWVKSMEFEKGKFMEIVKDIKLDKGKIYRVQIATGAGIIEQSFEF
jgi:hypothetical protein